MNLKTVGDKTILYVMAAELEYGVHLQKRFKPLLTGIGPVEAALSLSNALNQLSKKPDLVVCLGSAGSATLQQTKIYQVSSIAYRDMDVSALGYEKGVTPFLDIQASIALDITIEGIESASLSSGAGIVS
ncbi:MAG: 5'-methylthioadenosine/S-adenosylhomocysteine nucleosidase, partial [Nitratireductor sp.]